MAKMFYTLEETAEKLGLSEDQVKNLAGEGKIQQFRDRDKLMFKREQVDAMSANAASFADDEDERSTGLLSMADLSSGVDELALESDANASASASASGSVSGLAMDSDAGDAPTVASDGEIDLDAEPEAPKKKDPRQETGVSIFDADELEAEADPMAQTQITETIDDEEELALQSIGSGSGLLDLTREADDTSLGAELLDEIYPGAAEASDAKMDSATGSSGVFEEAVSMEASASGLDNLASSSSVADEMPYAPAPAAAGAAPEVYDGAGSGFSSGMLFGATAAMVVGLIIALSMVRDMMNPDAPPVPSQVTKWLATDNNLMLGAGGVLAVSIIFGLIGFFIGKSRSK